MSHKRGFGLLVLVVCMLVAAEGVVFSAGRGEAESDTIVFVPKSTDVTYWLFLRKGASDRAAELGYSSDYQGVSRESMISEQVDLVRNIAATGPAGMLIAATDADALVDPIEAIIDNGVPVVMVDSGIDSDAPIASITTDNYDGAYQAGQLLAEMIGGSGKVINLGITAGSQTGIERSEGFIDAMSEYPDIEVLPVQWTGAEASVALNSTTDLLTANPDVNGVYSAAAPMGVGAAQALKAEGVAGEVKLITFDPSPEVLPLFEEGTIHAIVAQDPYQMGYEGVSIIHEFIQGNPPEDSAIQIPVRMITSENYEEPEIQALLQTPDKF